MVCDTAPRCIAVSITVGGQDDPPLAVDDTVSTPEDMALVIAGIVLTANDTDTENQTLTVTAVANRAAKLPALLAMLYRRNAEPPRRRELAVPPATRR